MATPARPVLIVDDDPAYRASVVALLGRENYATREAATAEGAFASVREERPGCILLDVHLPDGTGYEVCRALREEYGELLPIVFVTGKRVEPPDWIAGLNVGADDYLVKPVIPDELLARLRRLIARAATGERLVDGHRMSGLTKREREVLRLLAEGLLQDEIARALVISPRTVETHIQHILHKLGLRSRTQAVAAAYREGLVELR
jgi:two-component system, NarL family, nitrate/nitrite response regulator NarL